MRRRSVMRRILVRHRILRRSAKEQKAIEKQKWNEDELAFRKMQKKAPPPIWTEKLLKRMLRTALRRVITQLQHGSLSPWHFQLRPLRSFRGDTRLFGRLLGSQHQR